VNAAQDADTLLQAAHAERPMHYVCTRTSCNWTGRNPSMSDMGPADPALTEDGSPPRARDYAAICPQCNTPVRRAVMPAPLPDLPVLTRVAVTPELIGGLALALSVLDTEQRAGRLAVTAQRQIDELRSLHLQVTIHARNDAKAAA
jgi:hypothetical protein